MSRRRYLSTDISLDSRVNRLAERSDFAALLYTWMIPHAEDDGTLTGDPEELLYTVIPGRRSRSVEDVAEALDEMERLGLIEWDRAEARVSFPHPAFYKYQTYIQDGRRRRPRDSAPPPTPPEHGEAAPSSPQSSAPQQPASQISAEQRTSAQNATSFKHSHSHSHSVSGATHHASRAASAAADVARPDEPPVPEPDTPTNVTPLRAVPKPNRYGEVLDALKARGIDYQGSSRDAKAVKDCAAAPALIAEAYAAAAAGEWGGSVVMDNLSIWAVCPRIGAYQASKAGVRVKAPWGRGRGPAPGELTMDDLKAIARGERRAAP